MAKTLTLNDPVVHAFCPTGEGGGRDNSCGGESTGASDLRQLQDPTSAQHREMKQKIIEAHSDASCKIGSGGGKCDQVSVVLWDKLGQPQGLKPYSVMIGEEEHVLLHDRKSGVVIDPTGYQFSQRIFTSKSETPYKKWVALSADEIDSARALTKNAFCPTGPGGGKDPTCAPSGANAASALKGLAKLKRADPPLHDPSGNRAPYVKVPFKQVEVADQALRDKLRSKVDGESRVDKVDLDKVTMTQSVVSKATVEYFIKSGPPPDPYDLSLPIVVKMGGKSYMYDGHHRAVAEKLQGGKAIRARVYGR